MTDDENNLKVEYIYTQYISLPDLLDPVEMESYVHECLQHYEQGIASDTVPFWVFGHDDLVFAINPDLVNKYEFIDMSSSRYLLIHNPKDIIIDGSKDGGVNVDKPIAHDLFIGMAQEDLEKGSSQEDPNYEPNRDYNFFNFLFPYIMLNIEKFYVPMVAFYSNDPTDSNFFMYCTLQNITYEGVTYSRPVLRANPLTIDSSSDLTWRDFLNGTIQNSECIIIGLVDELLQNYGINFDQPYVE